MDKPWNVHHKQDDAFREAGKDSDIHVFAVEPVFSLQCNKTGRKFIACTYEKFWWEYTKMMKKDWPRHFYEVIREDRPCHLYFDLEFSKKENLEVDGNKMVDDLIYFACEKLECDFGIVCSEWNVLRLDSSTAEKFSQHLIFRIPDASFRSNYYVGDFVEELCENPEFLKRLTIFADNGNSKTLIVDKAVYTKNRHFRLFQSSKKGKDAVLLRSDYCKFDFDTINIPSSQDNNSYNTGAQLSQCDNDKAIFFASLICNVDCCNTILLPFEIRKKTISNMPNTHIASRHASDHFELGFGCIDLDLFIMSLIQTDGVQGFIGSVEYDQEENTVRYSIRGNRYCRNIGRHHKSNNVFYVAYLDQRVVVQRCYDRQSCRDFYSLPIRLPKKVIKSLEDGMFITDVSNEDLVSHLERSLNLDD